MLKNACGHKHVALMPNLQPSFKWRVVLARGNDIQSNIICCYFTLNYGRAKYDIYFNELVVHLLFKVYLFIHVL